MGINLNIPGAPKFDESLIPWMNTMAQRIQQALSRVNGSYSGNTAARLALANAPDGTSFYDTQLKRLYIRQGGAWVCPHPIGILARAILTTNSAAFTSIIYPLQVTGIAIEANRRILVRVHANLQSSTANASPVLCVCDGSGTIANQAYRICSLANSAEQISVGHEWTGLAAGTYSFRLGVYCSVVAQLAAGATASSYIEVEDLGPT